MKEVMYTAGEIAKIAGVSLRTIRFYDVKGLLKPVEYSEAGYRFYNKESLLILQRILMLKYLGFSLNQIESMIHKDSDEQQDMKFHLSQQKQLLQDKKEQLEQMIAIIDVMEKSDECDRWNFLIHLLNLLTDEEKIQEQYQNATNLEKRIRIHDFSTGSQEWMDWVYEKINLKQGAKILEIGCGNALLWKRNIYKLPNDIEIVLTDRSEGMLEEARTNMAMYKELFEERNITIEYKIADANELKLDKNKYDYIIANHMLYHVANRENCLAVIHSALKENGTFCCSTVGKTHMRELHEMVIEFDKRIEMPFINFTVGFQLENAEPQLSKYFSKVERMDHENDLIVDEENVIYDYVYSYPGNAPFILDQHGDEFRRIIRAKLEKEGAIYIHKSTGVFICNR